MSDPFFDTGDVVIHHADSREAWRWLPESSAHAIVTSPPYFALRDYGYDGQLGAEDDPQAYIDGLADLLTGYGERVLTKDGSLWLNLGDTYSSPRSGDLNTDFNERTGHAAGARKQEDSQTRRSQVVGLPAKCLLMIPERVALALIERGWILRNKVAWCKPNGMPSSVTDRLSNKWEYLFHLTRARSYHYDLDAIREEPAESRNEVRGRRKYAALQGGRNSINETGWTPGPVNPGDWWVIPTQPYPDAHFAVYPPELVRRPILATVPEGGTVLDPFGGSGTTAVMARRLGRKAVLVELSEAYCRLAADRFREAVIDFGGVA